MGELPVSAQELELSSGAVPITLIYRTDAARCNSGEVLLLPRDAGSHRSEKTYTVRCDSNDQYDIDMVPPGDYYALALTGGSPEGMPTPGRLIMNDLDNFPPPHGHTFDSSILNRATTVTVRAGETSSMELKAFTRQLY
jgi:hypothetical protein